jgi:hypothetical protein
MPRNPTRPLSAADHMRQRTVHASLLKAEDAPVRVYYTKRDGSASFSKGPVKGFSGTPGMDTGSVTIEDPEKGPRTINLHRIYLIE